MEAKKLPDFIVRTPKRKGKNKQCKQLPTPRAKSVHQFLLERFIKADKEICPTLAWADDTLRNFKRVRDKVNEARSLSSNPLCDSDIHKVPHVRNTAAWKKIILGETDETVSDEPISEVKGIVYSTKGGKGPLLSVIVQFPQGAIIDFIELITSWVKQLGWCHQAAVWTYSLLACLELPVVGDVVAVLRDLSRTCSSIRSKHKNIENKSLITSLNLIICIIGQFFGQLDICDDYLPKELSSPSTSSASSSVVTPNEPKGEDINQNIPVQDVETLNKQIAEIQEKMRKLNEEYSPTKVSSVTTVEDSN